MTLWLKQGVLGNLQPVARKGLGRLSKITTQDIFVTSLRDGNHLVGSLHYDGLAFDIKYILHTSISDIRDVLGSDWDVVDEKTHIHCEYDPK